MATARPYRHDENNPMHIDINKILSTLSTIAEKMEKNNNYCPNVQELDMIAEHILSYINKHHNNIDYHKHFLKNAIIDLTEIPVMHPKMQRLAIKSCVNVAIDNIENFCKVSF
ncbi:MAG: hypothetical protein FJZ57_00705 [Chlamydiae bacterium]|nr:hypothetical protein [Chlamydiota bacterium]